MKITRVIFIFFITAIVSCEKPVVFTDVALNEQLISTNGSKTTLGEVLSDNRGKTILIDIWASWCSDCIAGLPDVKQLQKDYLDVNFLFLSVDLNKDRWLTSIAKYDIKGTHYFLPKGQKGDFWDFLNSNWTPRYMVIDTDGTIKLFKAKKATDSRIRESLN